MYSPIRRYSGEETWFRLVEWTKTQKDSERLAFQVLHSEEYLKIDPSHPLGGPDETKDLVCEKNGIVWLVSVYFPRGQRRFNLIKEKIKAELPALKEHKATGYIFFTNQELSLSQRKILKDLLNGYELDIYHLERISSLLNTPRNYATRYEFLGIPVEREEYLSYNSERDKIYQTELREIKGEILSLKDLFNQRDTNLTDNGNLVKSKMIPIKRELALEVDQRLNSIEELDRLSIDIKKKLVEFLTQFYSGDSFQSYAPLLDEIIKLAKDNENYSSLVEALKIKKWLMGFRQGAKEFARRTKEIEFYEYCNESLNRAVDYYYRTMMVGNFPEMRKSKKLVTTSDREYLDKLKRDYKFTKSVTIGYYYKLSEMSKLISNEDYGKAATIAKSLSKSILREKCLYRKTRLGSAYSNIAFCAMHLRRYDQAIENTQEACKLYPPESVSFLISKEIELYALFYSFNFAKALSVYFELSENTTFEKGDFRYAKYSLFNANILFKMSDFISALKVLRQKYVVYSDRGGWGLSSRILSIMTDIELQQFDIAALEIDSLIQFMRRNKAKYQIRKRYFVISSILKKLDRNGFAFGSIRKDLRAKTKLLASKDPEYRWEPMGPELIRFDDWIRS